MSANTILKRDIGTATSKADNAKNLRCLLSFSKLPWPNPPEPRVAGRTFRKCFWIFPKEEADGIQEHVRKSRTYVVRGLVDQQAAEPSADENSNNNDHVIKILESQLRKSVFDGGASI